MKKGILIAPCLMLTALLAHAQAPASGADAAAAPAAPSTFTAAQLEQLVAPIALYPDSLLSQILMASTYPLEIVQAQRWLEKTPGLQGSALETALKDHDWDPSVKSLCGFPDVLNNMAENLDWTQDLGDAFLGQRAQIMDAVQIMRGKAQDSGNLKTTEQQVVKEAEDNIIIIESSDPEVIYVPSYSPTVVYGGWGYSSWYYPSLYYPPAPGYGFLAFTAGVAWGAAVWGGCNWGWGHSDVNVDINRQNNFNRNTNINGDRISQRPAGGQGGRGSWNHDASHRKGVNYRDNKTAQRYGGAGTSNRVSRDQARGRTTGMPTASQRPAGVASQRPAVSTGQRPSGSVGTRPTGGVGTRQSGSVGTRQSTGAASSRVGSSSSYSRGSSAYSGSRGSSFDRSSSSRGASSRGASSYGGSRGGSYGGSRGGGGMSRGGGGRGGGGRR